MVVIIIIIMNPGHGDDDDDDNDTNTFTEWPQIPYILSRFTLSPHALPHFAILRVIF